MILAAKHALAASQDVIMAVITIATTPIITTTTSQTLISQLLTCTPVLNVSMIVLQLSYQQ